MPELATTPPPGDAVARLRATPPRRRSPGAELAESPPPEERDREERE